MINFVMQKCIQKAKQSLYIKAMRLDDKVSPLSGDEIYLRRLWVATSWIMSTEICRELMTSERISLLTDSIFKTYEQIYLVDKAWPSKGSWEKVISENSGIVLERGLLHTHYVGKTTSSYRRIAYDKSAVAQASEGSPFMQTESNLRSWDESVETTPIDTW
jgi:hypothetical protein